MSVLWWRDGRPRPEVPQTYGVGWVCSDGSATGMVALMAPHAWLDAATIEARIRPVLTTEFGPVAPAPAAGQTSPIVDLAVAGHRLRHADLALTYGVEVVGGVAAKLRGRGVVATVGPRPHRQHTTPTRSGLLSHRGFTLVSPLPRR